MISQVRQNGDKIYAEDDKGRVIIRKGYLVSFTENRVSYIASKDSKTVLVIDERGRYIHSFNVSKRFESGIGW